jgi:hypothetical protein
MAAVFRQQYAPGAVFAEQEASSTAQTITAPLVDDGSAAYGPTLRLSVVAPLVDAGAAVYAPSLAITGPQTVSAPLVDGGAEVFRPSLGGENLTQAGIIPKIWPMTVRYEGKAKRKRDEEEQKRLIEVAEEAVKQAADEATKKAMRSSLEASMRVADLELAKTTMDRLLTLAVQLQQERIEEEEIEIALLLI